MPVRINQQFQSVFHYQLAKDRGQVVANGFLGDEEPLSNLFVSETSAD
jgi:hypothetical protein